MREVYLPEGQWYDWYTHELFEGGRYVNVDAPLDRIPLFVRAGSIIPTTDVMQYIGEKPDATIYINVYPGKGKDIDFTLYEDDGESLGYQRGENTTRTFSYSEKNGRVSIMMGDRQENGGYKFDIDRNIEFIVYSSSKPKAIRYNNRKVDNTWDNSKGYFVVKDKE